MTTKQITKAKKQIDDSIFIDEFSKEIYEQTYKFNDETVGETFERMSKSLASVETDYDYWVDKFTDLFDDFKFIPGGRIISNAGTGLKGTTFINCFVDGFTGHDQDSMEGILEALKRQALILKSEGGYGFCADTMRPRGSYVSGIGNESPGAVQMLDMWDTQSAVITAGSGRKSKKGKQKIRKGAQMVTMSCWHPDIEEFIKSKQTPGRLTKFNMSVLVSDEFMDAVENNKSWSLEFPDHDKYPTEYVNEWDGNLKAWKEKGYTTTIFKTYENANELWDLMMTSTYNRNEPGILFYDTINKLNNLYYNEHITATNPCGEQLLPIGGVCLLGSLNLTQFIDIKNNDWDYDKLEEYIPVAIRFMDNVNDVTNVPLQDQKDNLQNKRRIGLGIMGYGSALMMMKVRYGSQKALELTDKLMNFIMNTGYKASADIAGEKGSFKLYDEEKYLAGNFVSKLEPETIERIRKNGMRNSHVFSIQPTGNTGILANVVSGGLEPIFMPEYMRTSIMPYAPEGLDVPKNVDWSNKSYESSTEWAWIKEGDENLLRTNFNGYNWKFDKSRGLLRETIVKDYAVRFLEARGEWDPNADWAATTTELSIDEHVDSMKILANYIDSAMSKCIVKGTLITTDKGILPIEELSNSYNEEDTFQDTNDDYKVLDENGELKNVTKHYYGGMKDSYEIKFSNGFKVQAAYTHKFKTEDGWKSVLDLEEGDVVFNRNNSIDIENNYIEIESPSFKYSKKYTFPKVLDEKYAKFLGMMLSDGTINNNSIGIVEKDDNVGQMADTLMKDLFGEEVKSYKDKRNDVIYHHINSRPLSRYFKNYIGENALTKKIPNDILLSNNSVKKAFIEGLTLDGYIKEDNNLVIYEGYSEDIAVKTSYILNSLGYDYYLGTKKVKTGKLSKISYMVKAYLTDKYIQPIEEHKYEYSTTGKKQKQAYVNEVEQYNNLPKTNDDNYFSFRNLRKSLKSSSFTRRELLDKLGIEYDNNLSCVKVTSVDYIGKKEVYDIEVEDTHSYLINGLVSHNTVNIPNEFKFEDFKDLYMKLYKTGTVKGGTTYRAGTMTEVLGSVDKKEEVNENKISKTNAPKRPKSLGCDIYHVTAAKQKWVVIVGKLEEDPYEIFAFKPKSIHLPTSVTEGSLVKVKKGVYNLECSNGLIIDNIAEHFETDEQEALTRMISTSLRHGADVQFVVEQLNKSEGTIVSFAKAIGRTLKRYIKDGIESKEACENCGEQTLVYQEGCFVCTNCGGSKCS